MKLVIKKFLNDSPDESGSIVVTAVTPKPETLEKSSYEDLRFELVEAQVIFRDCHGKPVNLNFSCMKPSDVVKRQEKIDVIVDALSELRRVLPIMMDEIERERIKKANDGGSSDE